MHLEGAVVAVLNLDRIHVDRHNLVDCNRCNYFVVEVAGPSDKDCFEEEVVAGPG
jgi:hypothetical protein